MSFGSRQKLVSRGALTVDEPPAVAQPRDVVMVKLKARPARAVAAAAGVRAAAAGAAGQPAGLVSQLIANGIVAEIDPVFPVAAPTAARAVASASRRALAVAALAGGAQPESAKRARGLTSLRIERGWNAAQVARDLMADPDVEYAYVPAVKHPAAAKRPAKAKRPARRKRGKAAGIDPLASRQWSHAAVRIHDARKRAGFREAADVLVAIVDSGVDRQHPDLASTIEHFLNFLAPAEDDRDYQGHGTHVAGIIAAVINNSVGIAGLCKARLAALKALPRRNGEWNAAAYYRALAHPIDLQAKVVNLSLGGGYDPGEEAVILDLLDAGVVVVAAMGNEFKRGNPTSYPAAYDGVIAVGATDEADRRASFSCTGAHIALTAPGERILSTVPTYPSELASVTNYDSWPGTSMATPHVAAAAALLLAKNPGLTPAEVKSRLCKQADRVQ